MVNLEGDIMKGSYGLGRVRVDFGYVRELDVHLVTPALDLVFKPLEEGAVDCNRD